MIDIKDLVLKERDNDNVVLMTPEGLAVHALKDFVEQPAEGILYDLNRLEIIALSFIEDPKWINDFAVALVIRELKDEIERLKTK